MDLRNLAFNVSFNGDVGAVKSMDGATDKLKKTASSATDKLGKMGDRFSKVGKSMMTKLTLPIVGVGTAAIKTVAGFDDSMSKVAAISGATGNDFDKLRGKAKQLGAETAFSASQTADAMTTLAAAGLDTGNILGVIEQTLTLASAGGMEMDAAAGMLTGTMAQFNLELKDTDMIMDTLVKGANSADTNVAEMGEAFKYAGGVANNMNMSVGQASAVLGTFANAQIKGSQAGTTFASMYTDLTGKVKGNSVAIGKNKVAVYDSLGNMRDMGSIMSDIEVATRGMDDAQRDAAVGAIFTGQSMKGVNAFLTQGADAYKELEKKVLDSDGAAKKASDNMEDNIGGAFRTMKSAMEDFMINIGDTFKDDVVKVAENIGNLASRFGKLPDGTKRAIVGILGVVSAIGPLMFGVGKVMKIMSRVPGAMDKVGDAFKFLASPMGITLAIIGILVAGFIHLYNTNEKFRDKMNGVWESIKTIIGGAVDWITDKWQQYGADIMANASIIWGNIVDIIGGYVQAIVTVISGIWKIASGLIDFFVGVFTLNWEQAWKGLSSVVSGAIDVIKGLWDGLRTFFKNPIKGVVSIFTKEEDGKKSKKDKKGKKIDGSNYGGLPKVPFDGYTSELHKNEEVLRASDPRNQNNPSFNPRPNPQPRSGGIVFNPVYNITLEGTATEKDKEDIEKVIDKKTRELFNVFFKEMNMQMA